MPRVDTLAAQNLETSRALLRGELSFVVETYRGEAFFVYSRNPADITILSDSTTRVLVSSYANESKQYFRTLTGLSDATTYYYRFCFTAETTDCGEVVSFTTAPDYDPNRPFRSPTVSTAGAVDVNAEMATLEGSYRRNDATNAIAFFVYGEDRQAVGSVSSRYDQYRDVDEQGDSLQKLRVGVNIADRGEYSRTIDDLDRGTTYYYSLCISYDDDEERGIRCGSTRSFQTRARQLDGPTISGQTVTVSGDQARFSATVDMEDFFDGHVFLVYGTNEEQVTQVEELSTFDRVRQAEDELQKRSLEIDFDVRDTFSETIVDLQPLAVYYYRFCVEYEAENDRGYESSVVRCGRVDLFRTQ
jgi:hypothetical protein